VLEAQGNNSKWKITENTQTVIAVIETGMEGPVWKKQIRDMDNTV